MTACRYLDVLPSTNMSSSNLSPGNKRHGLKIMSAGLFKTLYFIILLCDAVKNLYFIIMLFDAVEISCIQ